MGEETGLGQQLEEAALRYREAKARHTHLGEQLRFAKAAVKALESQCCQADDEANRVMSEVYRLAHGKAPAKAKEAEGA